ncbi:MAG: glycosyltransferase family 39 protein [Acidobacteria bacterium]|nr:glycosyltransferase family 39 protein [Acidobacteriota bacterium]
MGRWRYAFFALAGLAYVAGAGGVGFVGPDEPRYAEVTREMAEHPLVPTLWGDPWFEKPVLLYWVGMGFVRLLGDREIAYRMGSLLAALMLAWLVARVARGEGGRRGEIAATVLLASPMWAGYAHGASTDMLFSTTLAAAILFAYQWIEGDPRACYPAYSFLALALLAKGPAGPFLFALIVGAYVLYRRRGRVLLSRRHLGAILLFLLIGSPWYVYMIFGYEGTFFTDFILNHNLRRYATEMYEHTQPAYFYLPVLLLGVLPFSALLLTRSFPRDNLSVLSALAVVIPAVFFSFSGSKLPGYVLPCIPFLCIILSALPMDGRFPRVALMVVQVAGAGYLIWRLREAGIPTGQAVLLGASFLIAGVLVGLASVRLEAAAAVILVGFLMLKLVGGAQLDRSLSSRPLARALVDRCDTADLVLFMEDRATVYGLSYYAGHKVDDTRAPGEVLTGTRSFVLTTPAGLGLLRTFDSKDFDQIWTHEGHILARMAP